MRKVLAFAAVCVVLALIVTCWRALARHEAVIEGKIRLLHDLADALEGVKDRASARAAAVKINKVCDRLEELAAEMAWYREHGIAGCKFKVGGVSPEEDAARFVKKPTRPRIGNSKRILSRLWSSLR